MKKFLLVMALTIPMLAQQPPAPKPAVPLSDAQKAAVQLKQKDLQITDLSAQVVKLNAQVAQLQLQLLQGQFNQTQADIQSMLDKDKADLGLSKDSKCEANTFTCTSPGDTPKETAKPAQTPAPVAPTPVLHRRN